MVIAAMKLKDAYSLEQSYDQLNGWTHFRTRFYTASFIAFCFSESGIYDKLSFFTPHLPRFKNSGSCRSTDKCARDLDEQDVKGSGFPE